MDCVLGFQNRIMSNKKYSIIRLMVEVAGYSSAAIFGPLVIFLSIGFWLDKKFATQPKMLLAGLAVSFIVTNVLLFKKGKKMTAGSLKAVKEINKQKEEEED